MSSSVTAFAVALERNRRLRGHDWRYAVTRKFPGITGKEQFFHYGRGIDKKLPPANQFEFDSLRRLRIDVSSNDIA